MAVRAFAGAGKTTTLLGLAPVMRGRGVYLTFNKSNADEARVKFRGTRCRPSTFHSLGWSVVGERGVSPHMAGAPDLKRSGIMNRFVMPRIHGWGDYRFASAAARTMRHFCNSDAEAVNESHARMALVDSLGEPEMIADEQRRAKVEQIIEQLTPDLVAIAGLYFRSLVDDGKMSHDVYLKMMDLNESVRRQAFAGFDYALVDEGQDSNPVQMAILRKTGLTTVYVGDGYQQIYSWRGAVNALDQVSGPVLHLTESFRFGEDIAAQARRVLEARPDGGPEQRLKGAGNGLVAPGRAPSIAVLCRSNMGVLHEATRLADRGKPFSIDNAGDLLELVASAEALYAGDVAKVRHQEISVFDSWEDLCAEADLGGGPVSRVRDIIESDRSSRVTEVIMSGRDAKSCPTAVMTAHRAKGMEFPAVRLGEDFQNNDIAAMRERWFSSEEESPARHAVAREAFNVLYVAVTRAEAMLSGLDRMFTSMEDPEPGTPDAPEGEGPGRS